MVSLGLLEASWRRLLLSGQRAEPSKRREKAYWYKREGNKMEDAGRVRGAKEVKNEIVVDLAAQQALDGDVAKAAALVSVSP